MIRVGIHSLCYRIMCAVFFVILVCLHATAQTVTISPTSVTLPNPSPVTITVIFSMLPFNATNIQASASCGVQGGPTGAIPMEPLVGDEISTAVDVSSLSPASYSVSCQGVLMYTINGNHPITVSYTSNTVTLVVNGFGDCNAVEGTPSASIGPNTQTDGITYVEYNINMPYTLQPGGGGILTTTSLGTSTSTPFTDCNSTPLTGSVHAPTVTNGPVVPQANGSGTVQLSWKYGYYQWDLTQGIQCANCKGIESGSLPQPTQSFPIYTKTLDCHK